MSDPKDQHHSLETTAMDAIVSTTNFIGEPGHLHETSIRLAPNDDRVIWLLTAYDDQTVVGAFAALPDETPNHTQLDVVVRARQMWEQADPQIIERAERANARAAAAQ